MSATVGTVEYKGKKGIRPREVTIKIFTSDDEYLYLAPGENLELFFIEKLIPKMNTERVKAVLAAAATRRLQL